MCVHRTHLYVIVESLYLLRGQTSPFEAYRLHFGEGGNNATEESVIPESRPFEGVNGLTFVLPVDLRVVTVESPTPLTLTVVLPVDPRVDSNNASAETV
jgi:hypothetical protein